MLKKMIPIVFLFIGISNAANLNLDKNKYEINEKIKVHFSEMVAKNKDWVAIYPENSDNKWANVIRWKWTDNKAAGDLTFKGLPAGKYEVRVFYNNSYNVEVQKKFKVEGANGAVATVATNKEKYNQGESVTASFNHMSGNKKDWIAVYRAGTSNAWANVVQWAWIDGEIKGSQKFNNLPKGNYEVRVFFNNTYILSASYAFKVNAKLEVKVTTNKASYTQGESVNVIFDKMPANKKDWIGIYPAGSSNAWANVVDWAWTKAKVSGSRNFQSLPVGNYEARIFLNNSFNLTASYAFKILPHNPPSRVLYDDFEDGIDPRWSVDNGKPMQLLNYGVNKQQIANGNRKVKINGEHSLRTTNSDHIKGTAAYYFNFQHPAAEFKFLEVDMSVGASSHRFVFGVGVKTRLGNRMVTFASYYNHRIEGTEEQIIRGPYRNVLPNHKVPTIGQKGYILTYPGPTDYYVGTTKVGGGANMFVHYKINIEDYLRKLEPDNDLYEITYFTTSGGDYDNLALTNY